MITSLDKITVNTPEEYLNAFSQGYGFFNIECTLDDKELFNYYNENKNNSPESMLIYAYMLLNGRGTEIDYKNAMIYAKKSADYGNYTAMNLVGYMYGTGKGVETDYNIAFEYYKRAANGGSAGAYYNLGILYHNGNGVARNLDKALEMYKKAEELGHMIAIHYQADIYFEREEYDKAISLYGKSANLSITRSYFDYAYMLSSKKYGHLDYEKAIQYYQKLIDFNGSCDAMNNLAVMYGRGYGVSKDLKKAFELYLKASEQNDSLVLANLGSCYFYGRGTEKDYTKALEACTKSVENGGEAAAYSLLYKIYNEGLGTNKDIEKAKHYRELALSSNNIEVVLDCGLGYMIEVEDAILEKTALNKQEVTEKLDSIINKLLNNESLFASYVLAEAYFILTKIDETAFAEHNKKAIEYSKKAYEMGKSLVNQKMITSIYGKDFFDFNEEYDYVCYDVDKFNGYEIAGRKITYVPSISTKANNYSIEYWLPRARLAYAMYRDYEEKLNNTCYYKRAISVNSISSRKIEFKDIVYPNALYMYAVRYLLGYDEEKNEERATTVLKLCAERYHSRGALLYGKACELKGDYENAFNYYKIAYSRVYPEAVKRRESLPMVLLKSGEKITYNNYYEYGGEKKPCYEALENIILNYQAFLKLSSTYEQYKVFEDYLNSGYKSTRVNEICDAFEKYASLQFERFIEENLDVLSSPNVYERLLRNGKEDNANRILDNLLNTDNLDAVKKAKDIAIHYGTNTDALDKIVKKLVMLGDKDTIATQLVSNITDYNNIPMELVNLAKEKNQIAIAFFNDNCEKSELALRLGVEVGAEKCIEKYSLDLIKNGEYEMAKKINPNLVNHSLWGYLLYNWNEDALDISIRNTLRLFRLPTELNEKDTARDLDNELLTGNPHRLNKEDIDTIISYTNKTGQYFKGGILLLSHNVMDSFLLLTKHYMSDIDNLLKLCEIVLLSQKAIIDKNIFYFNKAMCLLSKGGFFNKNKAKGILKELVTLKHLSVLEKLHKKPYQPAIDFLDGKEVNEEYLLHIKI